jgi:hypothetical protein
MNLEDRGDELRHLSAILTNKMVKFHYYSCRQITNHMQRLTSPWDKVLEIEWQWRNFIERILYTGLPWYVPTSSRDVTTKTCNSVNHIWRVTMGWRSITIKREIGMGEKNIQTTQKPQNPQKTKNYLLASRLLRIISRKPTCMKEEQQNNLKYCSLL